MCSDLSDVWICAVLLLFSSSVPSTVFPVLIQLLSIDVIHGNYVDNVLHVDNVEFVTMYNVYTLTNVDSLYITYIGIYFINTMKTETCLIYVVVSSYT